MAAGTTYNSIATTTLGSANATITFSSIANTYTDLRVVLIGNVTTSNQIVGLRFNGDTATNYSWTQIEGGGISATSSLGTTQNRIYCSYLYTGTNPSVIIVDVFNYAGSTFKSALTSTAADQNGSGLVSASVGQWRSTSAITSLSLYVGSTMVAGTTAALYGITKA